MQIAKKDGILVFLDNEGPCTLNDNAQENMVRLAKECGLGEEVGVKAYKNFSNIDDIWGDFQKLRDIDPSCSSGHTLKVVLPFYKAMGATTKWLYNFARDNLRVVPNIGNVLGSLNRKYNVWMISTSYQFFVRAFCDLVGFDFARARCTFVNEFDKIPLAKREAAVLQAFMKEIAEMPTIEYHEETGEIINKKHQDCYDRIDDFIWGTVYNLPVGGFLQKVHPVGQIQKKEAVEEILQKFGVPKEKAIYVGDSQTDVQCVELLRGEGVSMMFNGKGRVCQKADVMYIGENAGAIEEVADLFAERGRRGVIDYYTPSRKAKCGGLLAAVTQENIKELEEESVKKRKEFRGIHIGGLT